MTLTPENEAVFAKLQAEAEAAAAKEAAASAAASKLFDPIAVLASAKTILSLVDDKLGIVKYGKLSQKEFDAAGTITDVNKRVANRIFLMLQKGYPDLTYAQFEEMPADVVMRITDLLSEQQLCFLRRTPAILKAGSKTTP